MREQIARQIFEEIRDRPFRTATSGKQPANNCYFKSMELVKLLSTLGYALRGRLGEINWHESILPQHVLDLYVPGEIDTHFYLEIFIDNEWKILDPTWNKSFAQKYNLPYSEFGADNQSCFKITRLYELEEQAVYAWSWLSDEKTIEAYMQKMGPFLQAINAWMDEVNT